MKIQRVINRIFGDMFGKSLMIYLDDISIFDKDIGIYMKNIETVFGRQVRHNFRVNPKKIQYCQNEVTVLGMSINVKEGIPFQENQKKIEEIIPKPKTLTELRSFLGSIGWFRGFLKRFSEKVFFLTTGSKKFRWTEEMNSEFEEISKLIIFRIPNYDKPFILRSDASNIGLEAVLLQEDEQGIRKPIEWDSRKRTTAETKYGISEKEMLVIFRGIKIFEYELHGKKFFLETDHRGLTVIRNRPQFSNNIINRCIETPNSLILKKKI